MTEPTRGASPNLAEIPSSEQRSLAHAGPRSARSRLANPRLGSVGLIAAAGLLLGCLSSGEEIVEELAFEMNCMVAACTVVEEAGPLQDGLLRFDYPETGRPLVEANYRNGVLHGPMTAWRPDGTTILHLQFEEGRHLGGTYIDCEGTALAIPPESDIGPLIGSAQEPAGHPER